MSDKQPYIVQEEEQVDSFGEVESRKKVIIVGDVEILLWKKDYLEGTQEINTDIYEDFHGNIF